VGRPGVLALADRAGAARRRRRDARAELEATAIVFDRETIDTGVCHMALFSDPDGNALMLHNRYKPYEVSDAQN
jgi:hypothetical protein